MTTTEQQAPPLLRLVLDQPGQWLNENDLRRRHWSYRNQWTKYWRQIARLKALPHVRKHGQVEGRVVVTVTFHWENSILRDPTNWYPTAKAVVDGLTDAKLWPDDNIKFVVGPQMDGVLNSPSRKMVVEVHQL